MGNAEKPEGLDSWIGEGQERQEEGAHARAQWAVFLKMLSVDF